MKAVLSSLFCLAVLVAAPATSHAQKPLTNDDVLKMAQAGLAEEIVVKAIESSPTAFDTSPQSLIALKSAGVSEKIITVMLSAGQPKAAPAADPAPAMAPPPAAAPAAALPDEVGVYLRGAKGRAPGELMEVDPEIVNWKSGGVLKSMATAGLTKGHVNGVVKNPHSSLHVSTPLEFIIRTPEGTSAAEYQLLLLDAKDDRREFRAVTGGIIHASGGADKNAVDFDFEKVASRIFQIKLSGLKRGEYGFLPPGAAMSSNAASLGKIYTFSVE